MSGGKEKVPGIGWAAGIDRLTLLLPPLSSLPPALAIVPIPDADPAFTQQLSYAALRIAMRLRTDYALRAVVHHPKPGAKADRVVRQTGRARFVVFLRREEFEKGDGWVFIKDLEMKTQTVVRVEEVAEVVMGGDRCGIIGF
ncbi:hypothetical protein BC938DRAFT_480018 [Jimgerdemannia flammicorona]|uniref:Anticodon-binding domain-containing protein n=1 Tax=Jimgerdemannia flammicorona TaxID=994334 RepID=A0A433QJK2_9FUNG|nr:hypothetical protein BC938DRAFT_480018 [Jimgerdemannia flammicorona]